MNSTDIEKTIKKYSDGKYFIVIGLIFSLFVFVIMVVALLIVHNSMIQILSSISFAGIVIFVVLACRYPVGTKRLPFSKKLQVEEVCSVLEYCMKDKAEMNFNYYIDMLHILKFSIKDMFNTYKNKHFLYKTKDEKNALKSLQLLNRYFDCELSDINKENLQNYAAELIAQLSAKRINEYSLQKIVDERHKEELPKINITIFAIRFFLAVLIVAIILKIGGLGSVDKISDWIYQFYIQVSPDLAAVYFSYITLKDKLTADSK